MTKDVFCFMFELNNTIPLPWILKLYGLMEDAIHSFLNYIMKHFAQNNYNNYNSNLCVCLN